METQNRLDEIAELCHRLIEVLKDEEGIYLDLIKKEEQKKEALLSRDAESLLKYSREQEAELQMVDAREEERTALVSGIRDLVESSSRESGTISQLVRNPSIPEEWKTKLLNQSYALRELMLTLKNISSVNREMLQDNQQLFESLIEEITSRQTVGYGPGADKGKTPTSLFVDING